jgi:hypothetical protein
MTPTGVMPASVAAQSRRWAWIAIYVLLAVLGLSLGYRQVQSPDIGFHLSLGRWMVENGRVPTTDPLTYTVPEHQVVDPQWLVQVFVHKLVQWTGPAGLVALTTGMTLLFGGLLLWRSHRRNGSLPLSSAWLMLLLLTGNQWEFRPHLFSWVWGSLVLLIMEEASRGRRRWLAGLPVLLALWVNTHSLFILGIVAMGAYLVGDVVRHRRFDRQLWGWCVAAGTACLINPYHIHALLFPLKQFSEIQGSAAFKSVLTGTSEFLSPFRLSHYYKEGHWILLQPALSWQLFAVSALAGMIGLGRRARVAEWLLFAGFSYIFWSANKNFGYFVMAIFPIVADGLHALGRALAERWKAVQARGVGICQVAMAGVCVGLITLTLSGHLYHLQWSGVRRGTEFDAHALPVGACDFLVEHSIAGRMLNTWNDGGYIAWRTRQPVFIFSNAEVMGARFYQEYVGMRQPGGFEVGLRKWEPTIVVVPYRLVPYWLYHLNAQRDWRLAYTDAHAAVFLHESVAPQIPARPRPQADVDYPVYDDQTALAILQRATSAPRRGMSRLWLGSRAYPLDEIAQAAFYMQTGELDACVGTCLRALKDRDFLVPELMLTLGHALNARKSYRLADQCFDAFMRGDDDPEIRRQITLTRQARRR